MADKKISALTAASTPLAGTEVLPIVQGGSTVKVSISDVTAGRPVVASSYQVGTRLKISATHIADAAAPTGNNTGLAFSSRILPCDSAGNLTDNTLSLGTSLNKFASIHIGDNLVIGTPNKGIVDSTGTTSLQFTAFQVVSNKPILAPSVATAAGNTASTPTATPVTLFTPSGEGVWIVNALVTLTGAPAAYIASSMIKASGGVLAATPISIATNMSISVSGANVQATQTSGGDQIIAFSYIRLF